ncbi:isoprenoid biosynthesis protein, partial [Vibrio xuii]
MKKVAVILSGSGVFDGAEIHEAVLALHAIEKQGASWHCFAPNIDQLHVINHKTGEEMDETRNVLVEAARIARGNIEDVAKLNVDDFDALLLPGGFGAAKNLTDFAVKGAECSI